MRRLFACLALAALTLACWTSTPSKSYAWGHGYGGWGYGGWGGYGWGGYGMGYGGYGWGYPGYGWGGYRGYGWGYPGWGYGGYGGYGWGWGGYPYYASYYSGPMYYYTTPYYASNVIYTTPTYITSGSGYQSLYPAANVARTPPQDRAYIRVEVPGNAQVLFDDTVMHETGTDRLFQTPSLQPKASGYTYQVTARWMQDGKERTENRLVQAIPGRTTTVNFLVEPNTATPASTQSPNPPGEQPASQPARKPGDVR